MPGDIYWTRTLKDSTTKAVARYKRDMNRFLWGITFLVVDVLWRVQLFVEKYFTGDDNRSLPSSSRSSSVTELTQIHPQNPSPDDSDQKPIKSKKRKKRGLFFDRRSGKRRSYQNLADLISSDEERALMSLCSKRLAKDDNGSTHDETDKDVVDGNRNAEMIKVEESIPRSKFTAIWMESCGNR